MQNICFTWCSHITSIFWVCLCFYGPFCTIVRSWMTTHTRSSVFKPAACVELQSAAVTEPVWMPQIHWNHSISSDEAVNIHARDKPHSTFHSNRLFSCFFPPFFSKSTYRYPHHHLVDASIETHAEKSCWKMPVFVASHTHKSCGKTRVCGVLKRFAT